MVMILSLLFLSIFIFFVTAQTGKIEYNVDPIDEADINNERNSRQLSFYPDPFGELDVDGRGYFSIPWREIPIIEDTLLKHHNT